jgi:hypothetical protein
VGEIEGLTLGGLFDELEEVAAELGDGDLHGGSLAQDVHVYAYIMYIKGSTWWDAIKQATSTVVGSSLLENPFWIGKPGSPD